MRYVGIVFFEMRSKSTNAKFKPYRTYNFSKKNAIAAACFTNYNCLFWCFVWLFNRKERELTSFDFCNADKFFVFTLFAVNVNAYFSANATY